MDLTQEQLEQKYEDLDLLVRFMPYAELKTLIVGAVGEEAGAFVGMIHETAEIIRNMPVLFDQEELLMEAVVHLHYFFGGSDWYLTEKDPGKEGEVNPVQYRCFGFARLDGFEDCAELGFISVQELIELGAELDLHWTPITLREVKELCQSRDS